jgi:hypothetical protein
MNLTKSDLFISVKLVFVLRVPHLTKLDRMSVLWTVCKMRSRFASAFKPDLLTHRLCSLAMLDDPPSLTELAV